MELLTKTKKGLFSKIKDIFSKTALTDDLYEEIEELLIQSDINIDIVSDIMKQLEIKRPKTYEITYDLIKEILVKKLDENNLDNDNKSYLLDNKKRVLFIIGVNGVGKTTSIAKIANYLIKNNKKVLIAAADTFRAAAIEQIEDWCKKLNVDLVKKTANSDPAAVVYEAMDKYISQEYDILIIDTAGRLHNKANLIKELEKMYKITINKFDKSYIESLIVLDSNTGQNAILQAKTFNEITDIKGIILTKYDGTSKAGVVISIVDMLKKPIRFLGVGEKLEDLKIFNNKEFIEGFFKK